ncbi:MAG: 3-phosphoshikimate 1-carboxyvinyltransferase [Actinobacteria bacterium]|nr:3-phosphoshikimate 1-carboxyvinyltransferase [Actinomycetota bacterium]
MRTKRRRERPLLGVVAVPGDKSISHRALILSALSHGRSTVTNVNTGLDVRATAGALQSLGAKCTIATAGGDTKARAVVEGLGLHNLREPSDVIDVGNSGTTMRCLLGVCAGIHGLSVLTGDSSIRARPMLRVVVPLRAMGATIDGRNHGDRAPLSVRGGDLTGADHELAVASAQVKTALLLAGLCARGSTSVTEPGVSRDHTERMLATAGADIAVDGRTVRLTGGRELAVVDRDVPGDFSSAMFLIGAALLVPGSELTIEGVGLNPTRIGALDVLTEMGADLSVHPRAAADEPVGSIEVRHSHLRGTTIEGDRVPGMIDELPILATLATQAEGQTVITGAGELRVKESDRIRALAAGLVALGAAVSETPDGLVIDGPAPLAGGEVDSLNDHRIAMSFAVAGLVAEDNVKVRGWSCVDTSFPEFLDLLGKAQRR